MADDARVLDEDVDGDVIDAPLVLDWRVKEQRFFTFEIPLAAIEPHVPAPLEAIELRPGVGLASLGWLRFEAGQFGAGSPEFDELFTALHVFPDLGLRMPTPRVAFLVHGMWSNSPDLIRVDQELIAAPARLEPSLHVTLADDGHTVRAASEAGVIAELRMSAIAAFEPTSFWGQHFIALDGLRRGAWQWEGTRADQMEPRNPSRLHRHPFFGRLDVGTALRPYRQMTKGPGTAAERFYAMTRLG